MKINTNTIKAFVLCYAVLFTGFTSSAQYTKLHDFDAGTDGSVPLESLIEVNNELYGTTSEGGTIEWDTTAFGKYKVASGVYMIFVSAQDGIETKVKKVMIIR